jgi:hypothetical protein
VIGVVNYVIAARPSLLNFVIADSEELSGLRDIFVWIIPCALAWVRQTPRSQR